MSTLKAICIILELYVSREKSSCAGPWPYIEHTIYILLFVSTLGHGLDKLYVYSNDDKGKKHYTFQDPRPRDLMLWRGHLSHNREYAFVFTITIYITLVAMDSRNYNSAFLCNYWFLFILWSGCLYAITKPSNKSLMLYLPFFHRKMYNNIILGNIFLSSQIVS